jgi:hypothetical protein
MRLIDEIEAVVGDFIPNPDERRGITSNIYYYARKYQKAAFCSGLVIGFFAAIILLKWLA